MKCYIQRYALICNLFNKILIIYHLRSAVGSIAVVSICSAVVCRSAVDGTSGVIHLPRTKGGWDREQWQGEGTCSSVRKCFLGLLNNFISKKTCKCFFCSTLLMLASEKTPRSHHSEKNSKLSITQVLTLICFVVESGIKWRSSRHTVIYTCLTWKFSKMKKGISRLRNVQDACYDATFLILLLFDHKELVCKNTAVWVDEWTGRVFCFEVWHIVLKILSYYVCQTFFLW